MDQKIVLELDRKVADQQSTLEKAGVAGFYVTTNPQVSAAGLAWHSLGATGPQRPHPLWGSSWPLGGLCHQRTSQLPAGHRPPCSGLLHPTRALICGSLHPCIPPHVPGQGSCKPCCGPSPSSSPFLAGSGQTPPTGSLPSAPRTSWLPRVPGERGCFPGLCQG